MKPIKLVQDTIDNKDIDQLIEWLKTYPKLTKGDLTIKLEEKFAKWVGTKYSVFVNSGSSANLLMLYALKVQGILKDGDKVLVSSLCWSTDISPILQLGLEPILIDCNLDDLSIDLDHLEYMIKKHESSVLLLISVLGLSPNMSKIVELCDKHNIYLLEDNCESQGTKYKGKKLGNFGEMASFSTYFGHTMSTIEGGFITTNNELFYNTLLQLRSHGWDRDLPKHRQDELRQRYNISDFNALYTFYIPSFNVRNNDIGAFLGINQLKKVDKMIGKRNENFQLFKKLLENKVWFPKEQPDSFTASFCIPVIFDNPQSRENAIKEFKENNIEVRPLIAGSSGTQPMYTDLYGELILPNCKVIDSCGMYVPNHPLLSIEDIEKICKIIIKNNQ